MIAFAAAGANNHSILHPPTCQPSWWQRAVESLGSVPTDRQQEQSGGIVMYSNVMRGVCALFAAGALTFAAGAEATGGWSEKKFSLAFSPASVTTGNNPSLIVRIKNEMPDGNSSINSVEIDLPSGFAVGGTVAFNPPYPGTIYGSVGATKVYVKNMSPVKKGQSVFLNLPVSVSSSVSCGDKDWSGSEAFSGSYLNGDNFKRVNPTGMPAGYAAKTSVQAGLVLTFVPPLPTSVVENQTFSVVAKQTSACAGSLPPVTVTLSGTPSASFTGSSASTDSSGQATLSGKFTATGTGVTVTASAPGYTSVTSAPFTVFPSGDLGCSTSPTSPPPGTTFSGSPPGVIDPSQTAFAEGFRGQNKDGSSCVLVNYDFTNNIEGSANTLDTLGNVVPPNGVSFVWDRVSQPDLTAVYSVTFISEFVDASGVPSRQTKICADAACSAQTLLKACVGTSLTAASLPPGEKVCQLSATSVTVPPGDSYYCTGTPPSSPTPACIQHRITILDIFDPVIIRN